MAPLPFPAGPSSTRRPRNAPQRTPAGFSLRSVRASLEISPGWIQRQNGPAASARSQRRGPRALLGSRVPHHARQPCGIGRRPHPWLPLDESGSSVTWSRRTMRRHGRLPDKLVSKAPHGSLLQRKPSHLRLSRVLRLLAVGEPKSPKPRQCFASGPRPLIDRSSAS